MCSGWQQNFNPRPPCGGRRSGQPSLPPPAKFQSTSSVRRTTLCLSRIIRRGQFQSTSSVRRTTTDTRACPAAGKDFNPRPPCGGRRPQTADTVRVQRFQSTSSVRRTTCTDFIRRQTAAISIHVLRAEDDLASKRLLSKGQPFQSTSSVRRTTTVAAGQNVPLTISIHVLRAEDDIR